MHQDGEWYDGQANQHYHYQYSNMQHPDGNMGMGYAVGQNKLRFPGAEPHRSGDADEMAVGQFTACNQHVKSLSVVTISAECMMPSQQQQELGGKGEMATLVMNPFLNSEPVDLGSVRVGLVRSLPLCIELPPDGSQPSSRLVLVRSSSQQTSQLEIPEFSEESLVLQRGEHLMTQLRWRPTAPGKFAATLQFRMDGIYHLQLKVLGEALPKPTKRRSRFGMTPYAYGGDPSDAVVILGKRCAPEDEAADKENAAARRQHMLQWSRATTHTLRPHKGTTTGGTGRSRSGSTLDQKRLAAAGESGGGGGGSCTQLQLSQPVRKRRRSGGAAVSAGAASAEEALARKSRQDQQWADKQAQSFTAWLNFVLVPDAQEWQASQGADGTASTGGSVSTAGARSPFKEVLAVRGQAQARYRAALLHHGTELTAIRSTIADKVAEGTLALRGDRVLHADVGLSHAMAVLLLCYNPCWLRLGLETVTGSEINMPTGGIRRLKRCQAVLRTFIEERIIKDPAIKAQFAPNSRIPSGEAESRYCVDLARHTLQHVLALVLLLDRAKTLEIMEGTPCLFLREAEVKTSEGIIKGLCQFMRGEGDVVKHLKKLGYKVSHVQRYVDEYDFTVTSLKTDLRDGVRLVRLAELLTQGTGKPVGQLTSQLRVPPVDRTQKMHNTGLAVARLVEDGALPLGTHEIGEAAKDIVDGHQGRTIGLLWAVISRYKLSSLVDVQALTREITAVVRVQRKRQQLGLPTLHDGPRLCLPSAEAIGLSGHGDLQQALAVWAQAVCHGYGVPIHNFTTSFADGRALCLLVHHYHPCLLPLWRIVKTTNSLQHRATADDAPTEVLSPGSGNNNTWMLALEASQVTERDCKAALQRERQNVALFSKCVKALGGVPLMLPIFDSTDCPDERTIVAAIAYLASRLLASSAEIRATQTIQRTYRAHLKSTGREELVYKPTAVIGGRLVVRRRLSLQGSEASGTMLLLSDKQQRAAATAVIQQWWRGLDRNVSTPRTAAAVTLQRWWRLAVIVLPYRLALAHAREAAIRVAQWWRGACRRRAFLAVRAAAVTVQAFVRCALQRQWYLALVEQHRAIVRLQAIWRGALQQHEYQRARRSIMALQAAARGMLARRTTHVLRTARKQAKAQEAARVEAAAATSLQRWARKTLQWLREREAQRIAQEERKVAIARVSKWATAVVSRQRVERHIAVLAAKAAAAAQAAAEVEVAAVRVQSAIRVVAARRQLAALRVSQRELQRQERLQVQAAVKLQSAARSRACKRQLSQLRQQLLAKTAAATVLQQWWRHHVAIINASRLAAAVQLEQWWRGLRACAQAAAIADDLRAQRQLAMKAAAAVVLQRGWRRRAAYKQARAVTAALQEEKLARELARHAKLAALLQQGSARIIQRCIRTVAARAALARKQRAAASVLGAWAVKVLARQRLYAALRAHRATIRKRGALQLQCWCRRRIAVVRAQQVRQQHAASAVLQSAVRMWSAQKSFKAALRSVVCVQALARMQSARKRFICSVSAAVAVQTAVRRWLACEQLAARRAAAFEAANRRAVWSLCVLQRTWRHRREAARSAVLLQARARGFLARQRAGPAVAAARAKVQTANAFARNNPGETLGARVANALAIMARGTMLTKVARACKTLELSTRYSPVSCMVVAEDQNAPTVLYNLIRSLNRSPPHQRILKFTLETLRNIARHNRRLCGLIAAPPGAATVLLDVMQMYRDNPELFLLATRLFTCMVAQIPAFAMAGSEQQASDRLASIEIQLRSKARAEEKRSKSGANATNMGATNSLKAVHALAAALLGSDAEDTAPRA
ncbi:hypothetical protein JKP88DRAFT_262393 [Tribonema minus]|uniref:Calponin-homology (CH) domain-containing protein n=1 Tax=Tribonema minus TaxID=303371 RepID=A0A835Z978_9STRA|nr:hypothetical protein JKP88DRAFT_262393 [Tribonema minus]